jgi:hypothetical protein
MGMTSMMPPWPEIESPIRWWQVPRPRQGVTIAEGHKNYELVLNLQLDIW